MRWIMLLAALSLATPALAMDHATLIRDARAYHGKMAKDIADLRITQVGTFTAQGAGPSGTEMTMLRKGTKWRSDGAVTMAGKGKDATMKSTTLFDGKDLWTVSMGMKMKVPSGQGSDQSTASYWSEPPAGSKVTGSETVGGRACWVVEYPETPANPMMKAGRTRVWIDKSSFVFVQSESQLSGKTVRTSFSDFRRVKGYDIPYLTTVTSDGKTTMTSKITKLEANTGLSDDLFDPNQLQGSTMGGPGTVDMDAIMKQAEEMKKKMGTQGKDK